ncbi:hypothetical protein NL676_033622 [Syzygium grande]|nr:hypothetical protein NL676_033622 [Syzygium grande]
MDLDRSLPEIDSSQVDSPLLGLHEMGIEGSFARGKSTRLRAWWRWGEEEGSFGEVSSKRVSESSVAGWLAGMHEARGASGEEMGRVRPHSLALDWGRVPGQNC